MLSRSSMKNQIEQQRNKVADLSTQLKEFVQLTDRFRETLDMSASAESL